MTVDIRPEPVIPEPITKPGALLGEAPTWDDRTGRLLWVDIWGGRLHETDPSTGETLSRDLGAPLTAIALSTHGTPVVTAGLCVLELTEDGMRHLADVPEPVCLRANDAAVDPAGRLWIGTMTMPNRPSRPGSLWRLDPGSDNPVQVLDDVLLANGLGWSPSGDVMYFVDSGRQRISRYPFDVECGELGEGEAFLQIPDDDGMPDGIAVDAEGGLWVALAHGGAIRRYTASGVLDEHITLPVRVPTSCTHGGPGLRELFVTTASRPIPESERADAVAGGAGALFRIPVGIAGLSTGRMVL